MLIEFTVGNFRSFNDPVTLSMVAAKIKARNEGVNQNNTIVIDDKLTLLTSAAIYGANASGKSNLINALAFMRGFVLNSFKETRANEKIDVVPFRLNTESEKLPSLFQMVFLVDQVIYRYGFEVDCERVVTEWLFYSPRRQEVKLFVREGDEFQVSGAFKGGNITKKLTHPNALFLSVAAQFNNELAINLLAWFEALRLISGLDDADYGAYTVHKFLEDECYRAEILGIIRRSAVDIKDVIPGKEGITSFKTAHSHWDGNEKSESDALFNFGDESEGTQKLFFISGPIVDALLNGTVLIIDEIDARFHPHLTHSLVHLFNSKSTNPKQAQLIFATHDTHLLSNKFFRRDQIWFIDKDRQDSSCLYPLAEIKVRNDASFENDYLQGRYGAIPYLGDIRHIVLDENGEELK
jgi:AAA15 family ATPase/GTPase